MTDDILKEDTLRVEMELPPEPERSRPARKTPKLRKAPAKQKPPRLAAVILSTFLRTVTAAVCLVLTLVLVGSMALTSGAGAASAKGGISAVSILDKFDMFITNQISSSLDGVLAIKKVYWLSDSDLVAPEPKADNFGTVNTPAEVQWVVDASADLIGGQDLLFGADTPIWEKEGVHYYYDDTILVITWKQVIDRVMYTMSEVMIAHPSQFRRFLAGGEFGSDKLYVTTDMAQSVNAVVATSGDFYRFRRNGAVVYDGQLRRFEGEKVDTCFINEDGDLLFAYRGDLTTETEAVRFVQDNKVRFSMAFGPILVDNGQACAPGRYPLGETNDRYSRAALCQLGKLHYLLVSAGGEAGNENRHTIPEFAKQIESFGVEKAYALDGGQTTVVVMNGERINNVDFGFQRQISDIIYFATAIPEGE